jgi:biopolymer transport protein TolR
MMQSIRRNRRRALPINAEINFTNLIDVAFVLLIIFMITAPIMQGGIELELPSVNAQPLTSSEAVVVSVTEDARIFVDQVEVTLQEFPEVFRAYMGVHEGQPISVGGDARVQYGRLMDVFNVLRELGYTDVQLLTQPVAPRRRTGG